MNFIGFKFSYARKGKRARCSKWAIPFNIWPPPLKKTYFSTDPPPRFFFLRYLPLPSNFFRSPPQAFCPSLSSQAYPLNFFPQHPTPAFCQKRRKKDKMRGVVAEKNWGGGGYAWEVKEDEMRGGGGLREKFEGGGGIPERVKKMKCGGGDGA